MSLKFFENKKGTKCFKTDLKCANWIPTQSCGNWNWTLDKQQKHKITVTLSISIHLHRQSIAIALLGEIKPSTELLSITDDIWLPGNTGMGMRPFSVRNAKESSVTGVWKGAWKWHNKYLNHNKSIYIHHVCVLNCYWLNIFNQHAKEMTFRLMKCSS